MTGMTVRRLLGAGAVVASLGLAVPCGTALAEGTFWERSQSQAGPNGVILNLVRAFADDEGRVLFERLRYTAGRNGARVDRTVSGAGGSAHPAGSGMAVTSRR
ncbi:hypothetical protein HS041_37480 [Planomonospora sp. ID67723]|uniref:hypothetical protein n=1 Tax=Planomonospora sp. ID67723 TaxID=2738134 RepID=UPI0018C35DAA|nr:hypothetical protein [Planomonospora sp. ID67723]MBG0833395.1 hypothetical protein [Planomonospora sp. ID67723]